MRPKPLRFAIIGCGLIGMKRLKALAPGQLTVACDTDLQRAGSFIEKSGKGRTTKDFREAVASSDVDVVLVAATNSELAKIAREAILQGKHVLIEKPVGINSQEIKELIPLAQQKGVCVRTGFNHRFHPSFIKAREIFSSGVMGDLLFIRGRYGHGGRVGYEKEWRADPKLAGGGELMDQGVHLMDLARWFLGDFKTVSGRTPTYFWDMKVEDNAFMHLETARGQIAWLHVSWTEWKNMFSFEIYGKKGKIQIDGLGGSYGVERLNYYQMLPDMLPPAVQSWEFPQEDASWKREIEALEEDIHRGRNPEPGLKDALAVLEYTELIYQSQSVMRNQNG